MLRSGLHIGSPLPEHYLRLLRDPRRGGLSAMLAAAALRYDAAQATGLDGSLRRLALESWGVVVVAIVGIGFAAYGIFCLATFTRRRLQAP